MSHYIAMKESSYKINCKTLYEMGHHNAGTNQALSALSTKYWIMKKSQSGKKNVQHALKEKSSVQNILWHPYL